MLCFLHIILIGELGNTHSSRPCFGSLEFCCLVIKGPSGFFALLDSVLRLDFVGNGLCGTCLPRSRGVCLQSFCICICKWFACIRITYHYICLCSFIHGCVNEAWKWCVNLHTKIGMKVIHNPPPEMEPLHFLHNDCILVGSISHLYSFSFLWAPYL